ncbi:MAG: DNA polymerase III subunit beta [Clostridia bacterium]|nr:DNA polymerase III subunit beta [Clostridia bacterium]
MKFTVNKSEFMNVLTPAMGTVAGKNLITAIEGVLIETLDNGKIRISTYDMDKGVRAILDPVSIEEEGRFIINAQRLYQTVKVLPEDELTIEVNDKLNCIISSGKANFSMFATRGEDFPNLPELYSDRGFEINAQTLRRVIGKVFHSIAPQDPRVMLRGAFFKIKSDSLEVVSCDNFTLSKCKVNGEFVGTNDQSTVDYSFIIPAHALSEIIKILPSNDDYVCTFYITRKHAIIKCDDIIFFTRTIDSEYIEYTKILPKDNDITVVVDRERLLSGLERANIIAEEKIQGSGRSYVKLKAEDDVLLLTSASVNGKVTDEMDCVHVGGDIEIGFNCRFLINSVRVSEGDEIKITLKSANHAITIEPACEVEDFTYFYMILPIRMNEQ